MKLQPSQLVVTAILVSVSAALASAQPALPAAPLASGSAPIVPDAIPVRVESRLPEGGFRASAGGGNAEPWQESDSLWNGILIGGAAGAVYGLAIAPPQFCGHNDAECSAIVKVAVGLPSIAAGAGIGALVDYFSGRKQPDVATRWHRLNVTPVVGRGVRGVQARLRF